MELVSCQSDLYLPQSTKEFFITNVTVSVNIIVLHEGLEFNLLGEESIKIKFKFRETKTLHLPESSKSLLELTNVKSFVSIEIHSLEDDSERANTNYTSLLDCELELEVQLTDHNIHVHTVESHVYF